MAESPLSDFEQHPRNVQYTMVVGRLLNQTETGVARVLGSESDNFLERQYGRLLVAIDINFTDDTYDISEVITDSLYREFYGDLNRGVEEAFEHALTATNQTLADLAAEGQNDWVGKLNAVVAVLHENELLITQVGNAQGYLVRGSSITQITEGLSSTSDAATAKTFLNIASGTLEIGDKLLLATGELFNHLALTDIRRHLYLHHPPRAIRRIADALLEGTGVGRLAAVAAELSTIDLISAEAATDDPEEIILSAPRRHFEKLQGFKQLPKDTPAGELLEKAKHHYHKRLKPRVARGVAQAKHKAASLQAKRRGELPPAPPRVAAGTPETHRSPSHGGGHGSDHGGSHTGRSATWQKKSTDFTSRAQQALAPVSKVLQQGWDRTLGRTSIGRKIGHGVRQLVGRITGWPWRRQLAGSRRIMYRNGLILLAAIFALGLFLTVSANQTKQAEARTRDKIKQIEALEAKAETSYIAKDFDNARKQLSDAKHQSDELAKKKVLKTETASLQNRISGAFDRINNVVAVPSAPITDFKTADGHTIPTTLTQSGTGLFAMDVSGPLLAYDSTRKTTRVANPSAVSGAKVAGSATTSNGDVLLLTTKPSVTQFDTATNVVTDVPVGVGGALEPSIAIDTVQQNIFLLDAEHNQIWRHTRSLSEFNKGEAYLTKPLDLRNAVDLVSGSQVYILRGDGNVIQFVGGEPSQFKVTGPPTPDTAVSAVALAVNFTTNNVYIADRNGRIVEYGGTGAYQRQFKSDAFGKLSDISVDEKTNTLYALADGKLYAVSLAQ